MVDGVSNSDKGAVSHRKDAEGIKERAFKMVDKTIEDNSKRIASESQMKSKSDFIQPNPSQINHEI